MSERTLNALRKIAATYIDDPDKIGNMDAGQLYAHRHQEDIEKARKNMADYGEALNRKKWYQKVNDHWLNKVLNPIGWGSNWLHNKLVMDPYRRRKYNSYGKDLEYYLGNVDRIRSGRSVQTRWNPRWYNPFYVED